MGQRTLKSCTIGGCRHNVLARDWCSTHYARWFRTGSPHVVREPRRKSIEERFWAKVDQDGPVPDFRPDLGPCWVWIGKRANGGYGQLMVRGRPNMSFVAAHRFSYELLVAPIPAGFHVDHLCRVPWCVRPTHVEPVTPAENALRGLRGRLTTHCPYGHEYTPENTYVTPRGHRKCRTCKRQGTSWRT